MAVFQSMSFSWHMSMENFSAASAVRLPLRVWSMKTLPSWIVNSKSYVLEVALQSVVDVVEFLVGGGHFLRVLRNGFGSADAGHDVFALGVDEKFTVEFFLPLAGLRVNATPEPDASPVLP